MPLRTISKEPTFDPVTECGGRAAHEAIETERFMAELLGLCKKHGVAIVPTYEGDLSFHDSMMIVPLALSGDLDYEKFLNQTTVYFENDTFEEEEGS